MILNKANGQKINPATSEGIAELVALLSGNILYPSGKPIKLTTEIIRPANVLDYAANDAVNSSIAAPVVFSFDKSAAIALGGGGMIPFAKIEAPAAFAGKTFTIVIYNDVPTTIQGDNVPFVYDAANTSKMVCQFLITVGLAINGSAVVTGQETPFIEYQCIATSKDLKALIFVNDAVVAPTSAGKITLSLTTVQQA